MKNSILKLLIFTISLLVANFTMGSYMDRVANAHKGYHDDADTLIFVWMYIIIIPVAALVIGLIAGFFMKQKESYFIKMLHSFLTTTAAVYLLLALPKFFIIIYKLIRDGLN